MPNYDLKNEKIEELNQKANEAMSIVVGEYRGLSVEDMCELSFFQLCYQLSEYLVW